MIITFKSDSKIQFDLLLFNLTVDELIILFKILIIDVNSTIRYLESG